MSYILDALRRAESERERKRGGVPGLNAQPVPAGSLDAPGSRRSRAWVWVATGVTLGLAVPLGWRWLAGDVPAAVESVAAGAQGPVSGSVGSAAPPAPAAAAPPVSTVAPPAPPFEPAPPPQPQATRDAAAPDAPARPKPRAQTTETTPRPAAPAKKTTAPAAAPQAPEEPVARLAELPEELRREVPALAFGGSVYSEARAQRMVIFNGQVLREGDAVTDALTVDEIRPQSAVLRIKGQRFEVAF